MRSIFVLLATVCLFATNINAQTADSITVMEVSYKPQIFGAVKAKFETSIYDGSHRFNVRNSRVGVEGLVSPRIKYMVQVDFSNEGNLTVLDSYAAYDNGRFEVSLGQQQYHFSTDVSRGPNSNIFANRSFIAKFLTTYYGSKVSGGVESHYTKSIGSRDLGGVAHYKVQVIPLKFTFGVYSGSGINNPEWRKTVNLVGKVDYGGKDGLGVALSHYSGYSPVMSNVVDNAGVLANADYKQRIRMWDVELRYTAENLWLQAEYAQRRLKEDGLQLLQAAHIQGYYQFRLPKKAEMDYIAPVLRWDMGDDIEFLNKSGVIERFSAHRATVGVNFGFVKKIVGAELRLNFEKYFLDGKPSDYVKNPLLQDKLTLEIVASF